MKSVMHFIGEIIALQATERKVVALNVLANILRVNVSFFFIFNKFYFIHEIQFYQIVKLLIIFFLEITQFQ